MTTHDTPLPPPDFNRWGEVVVKDVRQLNSIILRDSNLKTENEKKCVQIQNIINIRLIETMED